MDSASAQILKSEQGMFELSLINAEATSAQFDEVVVEALNRGIPPELVTRLKELWEKTKVVAGEIVAIGKIIVRQIIEFLNSYQGKAGKREIARAFGVRSGARIALKRVLHEMGHCFNHLQC